MIVKQSFEYFDHDVLLEGYYAYDNAIEGKRPLVLISHDWTGRTDFNSEKAEKLAALGYVGFALDMYGKGKVGKNIDEKKALMMPLMEDRAALQQRIVAGLTAAATLEQVDTTKIAGIGYCFGGTCVLDLARTGADVKGVVSFHGGLEAPESLKRNRIVSKILVLHGYDDKMVPLAHVAEFENEMNAAKADWQVHVYGGAMHAFTHSLANDPDFGILYNAVADKRSWIAMENFFVEIFK